MRGFARSIYYTDRATARKAKAFERRQFQDAQATVHTTVVTKVERPLRQHALPGFADQEGLNALIASQRATKRARPAAVSHTGGLRGSTATCKKRGKW